MNPEQERARQLIGLSDGERLMVALTIGVFGIGWSAIVGAWIAAASVGERLGVSGQPAIEAIFRLPTRLGDADGPDTKLQHDSAASSVAAAQQLRADRQRQLRKQRRRVRDDRDRV